ncbi:alpha/beta fold hydrolase [Streptomyces sp. AV19]|uniref:esterase/lipase family protein n=1 Tax=Streptomyces sp. AV19 TaxID=2793068 RepID=UPI0018FE0868|nr:alpha/beta fold hydrolase [Streptomyces sp. AV19]MBH1934460.1 alpha/beta fold hydrolase [Streptomyces sp. AV19]MDG4533251.1 alpha/beta fold hydrolase [Streptomyces sp. AV19]
MPPRKRTLRVLAGAASALALAVTAGATSASAAPADAKAPGTAKSVTSGWNNWSCKPSKAHPNPVVLLHGTWANQLDTWFLTAPSLAGKGYCVFSLDYGKLPYMPGLNGQGPLVKSAGEVSAFVDKVLKSTGTKKVDIVGHSQGGGPLPRYYLEFMGGASKVDKLIGIAPDNHGATASGLGTLARKVPGVSKALSLTLPGLEDQIVGSAFMNKLNSRPDTVPGVKYTVISTKYDEIATPWKSQQLKGPNVRNVVVQDLCKWDVSEHIALGLVDRIAFHEVANALDPAHATPTTCASALG